MSSGTSTGGTGVPGRSVSITSGGAGSGEEGLAVLGSVLVFPSNGLGYCERKEVNELTGKPRQGNQSSVLGSVPQVTDNEAVSDAAPPPPSTPEANSSCPPQAVPAAGPFLQLHDTDCSGPIPWQL